MTILIIIFILFYTILTIVAYTRIHKSEVEKEMTFFEKIIVVFLFGPFWIIKFIISGK